MHRKVSGLVSLQLGPFLQRYGGRLRGQMGSVLIKAFLLQFHSLLLQKVDQLTLLWVDRWGLQEHKSTQTGEKVQACDPSKADSFHWHFHPF